MTSKKIKLVSVLLVISLIFSMTTAFADGEVKVKNNDKEKVFKELEKIEKKHKVKLKKLDNSVNTENFIKFDTVEDFEKFVNKMELSEEGTQEAIITLDPISTKSVIIDGGGGSGTYSDYHHWKKWSPFSGYVNGFPFTGAFYWKHIVFDYSYTFDNETPKFTSITNIDSYATGLKPSTWNHRRDSVDISSDGKSATIECLGEYILGVVINGAPIGYSISDTWTLEVNIQ